MASNVSYISTYEPDAYPSLTVNEFDSSQTANAIRYMLKEMRKINIHLLSITEQEMIDDDLT